MNFFNGLYSYLIENLTSTFVSHYLLIAPVSPRHLQLSPKRFLRLRW